MRDMTEGERHAFYNKHQCPNCGSGDFYQGPSAGIMTNIKCAGCAMKLNVCAGGIMGFGQVIEEPDGYVGPSAPVTAVEALQDTPDAKENAAMDNPLKASEGIRPDPFRAGLGYGFCFCLLLMWIWLFWA